jgi:hypothetical protein
MIPDPWRTLLVGAGTAAMWLVGGCLTSSLIVGCSENLSFQEKVQVFEEISTFARDNDMAGTVTLHIGGDGKVYQQVSFGLDTDITVQASLSFNAADPDPAKEEEPTAKEATEESADTVGDIGEPKKVEPD